MNSDGRNELGHGDRKAANLTMGPERQEVELNTTANLRSLALSCRAQLRRLSEQGESERDSTRVSDNFWASRQSAEFGLWCFKVGVDRQGRASIDRRLKDVPDLCDIFRNLLHSLESDLKEFGQPTMEVTTSSTDSVPRDVGSDSSSSLSFDSLSSSEGSEGQARGPPGRSQIDQRNETLRRHIEHTIDRLQGHTLWIIQTAARHRQERVEVYLKKDGPKVAYEAFKRIAAHRANNQFEKASEAIKTRIAESFARRRIKFDYLRDHQRKRARESSLPEPHRAPRDVVSLPRHDSKSAAAAPEGYAQPGQSPEATKGPHEMGAVNQMTILSDTEITQLDPLPAAGLQRRPESVTSVVIRGVEFPPPPKITDASFECPYCRFELRASDAEISRWTQHVMHDFEPYFCTVEHCEAPFSSPDTFDGLMAHLQSHVPVRYHFDMPDGEHREFDHESELEDQIKTTEEYRSMPSNSLDAFKAASRGRGIFTFSICPFCGGYPDSLEKSGFLDPSQLESQRELRYHIKQHMQLIALFLPPYREDIPEDDDDAEGTSSARRQSTSETSSADQGEAVMICGRDECDCQDIAEQSVVKPLDLENNNDYWIAIFQGTGLYDRSGVSNDYFLDMDNIKLGPFIARWKSQNIGPAHASAGDMINFHFGDQSTTRPRCHTIPFPRSTALVERGGIFSELERLLPPRAEWQSAALWGLGGSGKTQVALEYAYRRWYNSAPCSVFWVHADNEATFTQDYQSIAKKLRLPANLQDEELLAAVRDRIEAEPSWVLVLDNADNLGLFGVGWRKPGASRQPHRATTDYAPKNLHQFVPRSPTGTVLWTSRDERIAGSLVVAGQTINVARMEAGEAVKLLETIRNRAIDDTEQDNASALLAELDWLPLAISQAAAYMRRTRTPIEEYLSKLKGGKRRWRILRASEPDVHRRCENIPEQMMKKAAKHFESRRAQLSDNEDESDSEDEDAIDAITRLREFSFLSLRASDWGRAYEMHKLVQEAARYRLRAKEDETLFAKAALRIADNLFPERQRELWEEAEKYLVHAQRAGEWAELCGEEEAAALLTRVSSYLYDRGRWRDREPVDKKAYELRREVLGDRHPDTIQSMASLATTYHSQGRYDEAEKMRVEVLALQRDMLGDKHPDTIGSMADLATTYHSQGRYDEAEKMEIKVLALRRDVLGDKHPDTIGSMASLATTYHNQGRYDEAKKISVEVLALRRDVLGDKHPDTIGSMADLATTYHSQGRYDEAEKMEVEVLALRRDVLGDKHPDTIGSMADLATTYGCQGRYDEVEKMQVEVLALRRDVLGDKHPDTIRSMADLATTYHNQRRYDEAEKINMEALALRRDVLGDKHPHTIQSMYGLAFTWNSLGRYDEALALMDDCARLRSRVLGPNHPDTQDSLRLLTSWKRD
ncbi:hypothetical protein, variant [Gaeumannomyces tritici R3-111a-1]|uniref:ORC1/DEAH AAA+ ATPase domain-containing protein n=1 Tax=Gaeumannomyces tritici (strain R3-111a-1) TaxID=644352 RepID=J3PJ38_GAET3|nr:hypothetical protein, variant [Gaeumannomyces tritici R3-111a-1]EJT68929.1 hypothetical protein, variant [Gaeumannomyces tritici R3-111a-1]